MAVPNKQVSPFDGQPSDPREVPDLERVTKRLSGIYERLLNITADLASVNIRLHGERPTTAEGESCVPARAGAIGTIMDRIDEIDTTLERACEEAKQICSIA